MKKVFHLMIALVMVLSLLAVPALAADSPGAATLKITADKTEVSVGDTITYTISVENNSGHGIAGVNFTVNAPDGLTFKKATEACSVALSEDSNAYFSIKKFNKANSTFSGSCYINDDDDSDLDGIKATNWDVLVLTYTVGEDAASDLTLGLSDIMVYDGVLADYTLNTTSAAVALKHEHVAAPDKANVKAATCTEEGYTGDVVCSICGQVMTKGEATAKIAHTYGDAVVVDATCTTAGSSTKTCTVCGESTTETIAALGHNWNEGTVTKAATCTEAGKKTVTCDRCGATEEQEIAALGHAWDDGTVTTEPKCEEAGVKTYTCRREGCNETKTEEIAALGHDWDQGTVTTEPTCTEAGVRTYTCNNDNTHTTTEAIAALGHDLGEVTPTKEATCTEEGAGTAVCKRCNETVETTIDKIEHTWDEGKVTKEATATTKGEKTYTCSVCGETKVIETPATGTSNGTNGGNGNGNGNKKTDSAAPKTGDASNIALWVVMMSVCAAGVVVISTKKKTSK